MAYWLMKSEPDVFSIEDLRRKGTAGWDGVRNYQARNFMRAMKKGDRAVFYHSNGDPAAAAGVMEIVREAYADPTQFDAKNDHHDPDSSPAQPRWSQVDVKFVRAFKTPLTLAEIKAAPALKGMALLKLSRLSVQPVTPAEWACLMKLRP